MKRISCTGFSSMNISKYEQRVLHALALGGRIDHRFDAAGRIAEIDCLTREGWRLADCTMPVFCKLRKRRLIGSLGGGPYRITRAGLAAVRAQFDQR
jgi:uncharacterized protein